MSEQIYYHFLSAKNAFEDLERERIKISLLDDLNDLFEFWPYLRHKTGEEIKRYQEVHKAISREYGLLCFSTDRAEQLLWTSYADRHKGIAIGFEVLNKVPLKVDYTSDEKRPKILLTDDLEKNKKLFLNLATKKYERWKHENEHRILVKLDDCLRKDPYFLNFENRLNVKEVVLGSRFDYKNEKEYAEKLANKFKAIVISTRPERQGYKITKRG